MVCEAEIFTKALAKFGSHMKAAGPIARLNFFYKKHFLQGGVNYSPMPDKVRGIRCKKLGF